MHRADGSKGGGGLTGLAVLTLGAYAAQVWLGDSPYGMDPGQWPWIVALRAAALASDWPQGVKFAVIFGSSCWVLRAKAPRPAGGVKAARRPKAPSAPYGLGLEAAR